MRSSEVELGAVKSDVVVQGADQNFRAWGEILALLRTAFAYQRDRIDPPSSVDRLDEDALASKATEEQLIIALRDERLVGCVFAKRSPEFVYLGKLAVWPHLQGAGIGRMLVKAVEDLARNHGLFLLELETRIELKENHETFAKLGFVKVAEKAHEGFDRPTFITMQKRLSARAC